LAGLAFSEAWCGNLIEMTEDIYRVKLENIFEGPMDLLVHLIKKNEMDIYDIKIALITKQYLEYLEWMKLLNVDIAGDFLVLASTLTQLKSKMLLPVHEDDEEDEDPLSEITKPLAEYMRIKFAAEDLARRPLLGDMVFTRPSDTERKEIGRGEQLIKVGLFELIDAFRLIIERTVPDQRVDLVADTISVKDKISQIIDILETKGSITFEELFAKDSGKSEIIVTFLAILEMVKLNLVEIAQHVQTGIIRIFYI